MPRPLTHDLLRSVLETVGASVSHILVSGLESDTFYAKITISMNGNNLEIDSRPSDAIALAVRVDVPIYAEDQVLEKAGILMDKETGKPILPGEPVEGGEGVAPEVKEEDPSPHVRLHGLHQQPGLGRLRQAPEQLLNRLGPALFGPPAVNRNPVDLPKGK